MLPKAHKLSNFGADKGGNCYRFTGDLLETMEWQLECEVLVKVLDPSGVLDIVNRECYVLLISRSRSGKVLLYRSNYSKNFSETVDISFK